MNQSALPFPLDFRNFTPEPLAGYLIQYKNGCYPPGEPLIPVAVWHHYPAGDYAKLRADYNWDLWRAWKQWVKDTLGVEIKDASDPNLKRVTT